MVRSPLPHPRGSRTPKRLLTPKPQISRLHQYYLGFTISYFSFIFILRLQIKANSRDQVKARKKNQRKTRKNKSQRQENLGKKKDKSRHGELGRIAQIRHETIFIAITIKWKGTQTINK